MQRMIREVRCDRCGSDIYDLLGGYNVRRLGDSLFDLCPKCDKAITGYIRGYESGLVVKGFFYREGRPLEDGDKYEE